MLFQLPVGAFFEIGYLAESGGGDLCLFVEIIGGGCVLEEQGNGGEQVRRFSKASGDLAGARQ